MYFKCFLWYFQEVDKWIMHTVISWRSRPETRRYIRYENPCIVLLGNAICYVISGLILLVVGVIITSLTFQNLERYENEKTERYAGPILIVVGILVLARGAFSQIKAKRTNTQQSFVIRSYTGELLTRPIMEVIMKIYQWANIVWIYSLLYKSVFSVSCNVNLRTELQKMRK